MAPHWPTRVSGPFSLGESSQEETPLSGTGGDSSPPPCDFLGPTTYGDSILYLEVYVLAIAVSYMPVLCSLAFSGPESWMGCSKSFLTHGVSLRGVTRDWLLSLGFFCRPSAPQVGRAGESSFVLRFYDYRSSMWGISSPFHLLWWLQQKQSSLQAAPYAV